jgi:hypothetical protein
LQLRANGKGSLQSSELQHAATAYLSSVTVGAPSTALSKAAYQDNTRAVGIIKELLSQAMTIDHDKTLFDTTLCTTYLELIIPNSKASYVIGTQVLLNTRGGVALVNTVSSSRGNWQIKYDSCPSSN